MVKRDPAFDIDQRQCAMRHLYLDILSRYNGATIAGRGDGMPAETSTCLNCDNQGYYARNWYTGKADCIKKSSRSIRTRRYICKGQCRVQGRRWAEDCSSHKSTSHGEADCYAQGAPRPSQNCGAHIAVVPSASSRPADDDEKKPPLNFDDAVLEAFAYTGLVAGTGGRR